MPSTSLSPELSRLKADLGNVGRRHAAYQRLRELRGRAEPLLPELSRRAKVKDVWEVAHAIAARYFITQAHEDLEALVALLKHKKVDARIVAKLSLEQAGRAVRPRIEALLEDGTAPQRLAARDILHFWRVTDPAYLAAHAGEKKQSRPRPTQREALAKEAAKKKAGKKKAGKKKAGKKKARDR